MISQYQIQHFFNFCVIPEESKQASSTISMIFAAQSHSDSSRMTGYYYHFSQDFFTYIKL